MAAALGYEIDIGSRAAEVLAACTNPQWYAAYTASRHEKCVARQIAGLRVDCFLPVYRAIHRWKDRKQQVELPLFPGYVFVHMALRDRLQVLRLPGVAYLVGVGGVPAAVPDCEIQALRKGLNGDVCAEPHPYLKVGRRVRICGGPLAGIEGVLVRKKDKLRVVLSIDLIMSSVAVEVESSDVEAIG